MATPTRSFQISLEHAAWLIYAFLRQPDLNKIATNEAIGGTIDKTIFTPPQLSYKGGMAWYCRNYKNDPAFPSFFIAIEDGEYDIGNVPVTPKSSKLVYSNATFAYTRKVDEANVMDMLRTDKRALVPDGQINSIDVTRFLYGLPNDPVGRPYNFYPCSFFENRVNYEVSQFVSANPDIVAVRYYFGYDDSDKSYFTSNRIRIILIGVNANGENILPMIAQSQASTEMLQNSWPPPPPIN
jgi:hypothetical protein